MSWCAVGDADAVRLQPSPLTCSILVAQQTALAESNADSSTCTVLSCLETAVAARNKHTKYHIHTANGSGDKQGSSTCAQGRLCAST